MIPNAPPLQIKSLVKDYPSHIAGKPALRAVNNVSFEIQPGEIFGLLGPNGAGKTSLISTVVTLEKPTSGEVLVFGHNVTRDPRKTKALTGFVPQELIHHGYFDVNEILVFHSGYYGRSRNQERIDWLLQRLGLWDHRHKKVKQLSGGMKRRLLIAKALVHEPKLLLLDEPTAGVDIELRESLWKFVVELQKQGLTILLTTHYIQEAEQLCDRVGILQKGQIKRLGPTKALIQDLTKREVHISFTSGVPTLSHPDLIRQKDNTAVFQVSSTTSVGDLLSSLHLDLAQLKDIQIREGSLEDALRHVLGPSTDASETAEVRA
jgi:ABC-2 type transport system ATP-binding protein